jgi:hypothetical protein
MAYNPFNIFRRNQKALFAVLTVFIMIMFTLSSGVAGGDFFETVGRWLGATRGEVLCRIDGRKVTSVDLDQGPRSLQFKRQMANRFMYYAANETIATIREYAKQQSEKLSPAGRNMYEVAMRGLSASEGQFDQRQMQIFAQFPALFEQQRKSEIARAFQSTALVLEAPGARDEDKAVARAFQTVLNLSEKLHNVPRDSARDQYFTNVPGKTRPDLIEFMLWEKKADQLGIRFSRDDVKQLIQQEFSGYFRSDVNVRKRLQDMHGFTMEACLDALAAEFRVRAAQIAVLGYQIRFRTELQGAPVFSTPYEAFEFFRDQCSPTTYELIAIPAAAYLDRVTGEPSESEINDLYKKHENDEPNPKNESPGFKTPRKIAIGFLGMTGEEPYYKKLAEEQIKVGEVMAKASGALTVPVPGMGAAYAAKVAVPLSLKAPAVDAAYAAKVEEFRRQKQQNYEKSTLNPRFRFSTLESDDPILPTNAVRPGVAAATLGAMVGQTAGFGNPIAAASLCVTGPLAYEMRERVGLGVPLALGLVPGPGLIPTAVGGVAAWNVREPKPLPIEALRPELLKGTIEKRAKELAFGWAPEPGNFRQPPPPEPEKGDVTRFTEELKKLSDDGKPKDRAAVEKYIKEFIAARGLTVLGASTRPQDEWALEDDPKMAPLVEAQKASLHTPFSPHRNAYVPFGRSFFWTNDFSTFPPRLKATSGLYLAETYPPQERDPRPGQMRYVIWRTEDLPSKKVDKIAARDAVRAAWKRIKAREQALAAANEMANKIRANPATSEVSLEPLLNQLYFDLQLFIKDPKASLRARKFDLANVAPLVLRPGQFGAPQMGPFAMTESENIPYPTPEMATGLVDNRDKGFKTVLVLPDAPKDVYYVAVVMKRELKTPDEFRTEVFSTRGQARDVLELYRADAVKKSRESVLELLRKEFRYEVTEEQKKKLEENARSGGRSED